MASVDQLLSRGTPTATLRVPLDGGEAAAELAKARNRASAARLAGRPTDDLDAEVEAAEEAAAEAEVTVALRGLARSEYRRLEEAHPPADVDVEKAKKDGLGVPAYNPDTFLPALVAACMTDPELTLEEAEQLFDSWSAGDLAILVRTAQTLCTNSQIGAAGKR